MTTQTRDELMEEVKAEIAANKIMIYTKGTKEMPRCGFTQQICQFFDKVGKPYHTVDILDNPEKRQLLNEMCDWPTTPKVFIDGEFYGGNDTIQEMVANNEFQPIIDAAFPA